jgi:ferrous iron transport protein A
MKKLSELKTGQTAVIAKIEGDSSTRRRIMDMGVIPRSQIKMIRSAPLGDPLEFDIKDYNLTLRKRDAEHVLVELE